MKKHTKLFIILGIFFTLCVSLILTRNNKVNNIYEETSNSSEIKKSFSNDLALMIETGPRTGTYEKSTDGVWPTDDYVFNKKLSKCLNGGELTWDEATKKVYMSSDSNDKCYVYFNKALKLTEHVISQFTGTQGGNNIYYHDSSLANGAGDNSYRYAGASENVDNFVCFGSNETPCPTDNLYRIIGVFGNNVKLIKYDYATSTLLGTDGDYQAKYSDTSTHYKGSNYANISTYYWNNSTKMNTWSASLLNKINLNTNFINNIGTKWANKIATTTWKVGGNTSANLMDSISSVVYLNEVVNPVSTNTTDNKTEYTSKIGLMYISDYGFAASPSTWTKTLYDYQNSSMSANNWMYMGLSECTISRISEQSNAIIYLYIFGGMSTGNVHFGYAVRPTFSLLSSTIYVSGSGSADDPILIK